MSRRTTPTTDHHKDFLKLIREASGRYGTYDVFRDFCEMAAISFSNAVDPRQRDAREAEYMKLAKKHADRLPLFPKMLATLTMAMEEKADDHLSNDIRTWTLSDTRIWTP